VVNLNDKKVEIEYPCRWEYKVIVECENTLKVAVFDILDIEYTLTPSKSSSSGKYKSFNISLTVTSHTHRIEIFEKLKSHNDIKYVL
jgi:putative lipoic acid-binding regulatory protein